MPNSADKLAEILDQGDDALLADDGASKEDLMNVLKELAKNEKFRPKVAAECNHLSEVLRKEKEFAAKQESGRGVDLEFRGVVL